MARAGEVYVRLCLFEIKDACSNSVVQFESVSFDPRVRFIRPESPVQAGGARLDPINALPSRATSLRHDERP